MDATSSALRSLLGRQSKTMADGSAKPLSFCIDGEAGTTCSFAFAAKAAQQSNKASDGIFIFFSKGQRHAARLEGGSRK